MLTSRIVRSRARVSLRDTKLVEETRDIGGCYRKYPEGLGDSSGELRENTRGEKRNVSLVCSSDDRDSPSPIWKCATFFERLTNNYILQLHPDLIAIG
jgi:hypothetical protein